jgi:hypothetical protein
MTTLFSHSRRRGIIKCPRTLVVKSVKCPVCWVPVTFVYIMGEQTRVTAVSTESWARQGGSPYFIRKKHDVHMCPKFYSKLKLLRISKESDFVVEMPELPLSSAPTPLKPSSID